MGTDYFFVVKDSDSKPGKEILSFALSRASSMGPCLQAYADLHVSSPQIPGVYCLTKTDWDGFMKALRAELPLISGLTACVQSVFEFDPDIPDEIRAPGPEDWKQLALFDRWFDGFFSAFKAKQNNSIFSLEESHFHRGVLRAFALQLWLELDPEVQKALQNPQNRIYLLIG